MNHVFFGNHLSTLGDRAACHAAARTQGEQGTERDQTAFVEGNHGAVLTSAQERVNPCHSAVKKGRRGTHPDGQAEQLQHTRGVTREPYEADNCCSPLHENGNFRYGLQWL